MHGVFLFPGRRLHFLETRAHDDLHVLAAHPPRRAAAVHGSVAAAQHDHPLADLVDMTERDIRQPIDADVDVRRRLVSSGNIEIAPAGRARADEYCVEVLGEEGLEAVDTLA